jgi:hypothetical protein
MELFLAISQGSGLSLATGVRPFLPPLVAGVLARADLGLDFSGTDYSFLESVPFLAAIVLLALLVTVLQRGGEHSWLAPILFVAAVAIGSLEFAGSLAGEGYSAGAGALAGGVCALIGRLAAMVFVARAGSRLVARGEAGAASFLNVYADAASFALAVIAIALPPLSYFALAFCVFVLVASRRRAERKYEGLRVLR